MVQCFRRCEGAVWGVQEVTVEGAMRSVEAGRVWMAVPVVLFFVGALVGWRLVPIFLSLGRHCRVLGLVDVAFRLFSVLDAADAR